MIMNVYEVKVFAVARGHTVEKTIWISERNTLYPSIVFLTIVFLTRLMLQGGVMIPGMRWSCRLVDLTVELPEAPVMVQL